MAAATEWNGGGVFGFVSVGVRKRFNNLDYPLQVHLAEIA